MVFILRVIFLETGCEHVYGESFFRLCRMSN